MSGISIVEWLHAPTMVNTHRESTLGPSAENALSGVLKDTADWQGLAPSGPFDCLVAGPFPKDPGQLVGFTNPHFAKTGQPLTWREYEAGSHLFRNRRGQGPAGWSPSPSGTVQRLFGLVADYRFEGIHLQPAKYAMQRGHAPGLFQAESQRLCHLRVLSAPLGDGV